MRIERRSTVRSEEPRMDCDQLVIVVKYLDELRAKACPQLLADVDIGNGVKPAFHLDVAVRMHFNRLPLGQFVPIAGYRLEQWPLFRKSVIATQLTMVFHRSRVQASFKLSVDRVEL